MPENFKVTPILVLTILLGVVLFGSVVFVLIEWHDIDAVLYAILGAALGWCSGMLIVPYKEETERFAQFSKTVSAFLTGFLVSKVESVWALMTNEQHRGLFFDPVVQRRAGICATCFFLVGAVVFKSRSYLHRPSENPDTSGSAPHAARDSSRLK